MRPRVTRTAVTDVVVGIELVVVELVVGVELVGVAALAAAPRSTAGAPGPVVGSGVVAGCAAGSCGGRVEFMLGP
ncbi:hypothetical protein CUD01_02420 [Cellulomonas uda]|uniref:Uncharacterized protein n=1 Tax=Cellulomonas uda TaxID=1714 RepID=A0A4Y3K9Z7_CELUD|nr:hypothetical protein CUD01_02420 [Cellulomonas uda]